MKDFNIVEATLEHARAMAPRVRPEDAAEFWAAGQRTPLQALEASVSASIRAWAWLVDGAPIFMCGVASANLIGDVGMPWAISAVEVGRNRKGFLRVSQNAFEQIVAMFPKLENRVDARYAASVRWLKWLGFTVHPAEPYGAAGLPFHRFTFGGGF